MEDSASRLGQLAAVMFLAAGVAGCAAPNPQHQTLLGFLGLASPAQILEDNAKSDNAAIAKAAKIKKQQCLQCKKVKAIRLLAKVGCGCYDKDGEVSKALLAALGDCDEVVRLEAVKAIMKTARDGCCDNCGTSCCKKDIVEQLAKMAYELDDKGCWIEPSERVRNLAAQAAEICCPCPEFEMAPTTAPVQEPVTPVNPELKREPTSVEESTETPAVPAKPGTFDEASRVRALRDRAIAVVYTQVEYTEEDEIPAMPEDVQLAAGASKDRAEDHEDDAPGRAFICNYEDPIVVYRNVAVPVSMNRWPTGGAMESAARTRRTVPVGRRSNDPSGVRGIVRYVDAFHGVAHVEFGGTARVAPGTRVVVEHQALFGKLASSGVLEVVSSEPGAATVKALGDYRISRVASGDQVFVSQGNS